ncbi:hypothetical protein ACVIJW_003883 [Bradyrhizobium barranii subsp. barranii]
MQALPQVCTDVLILFCSQKRFRPLWPSSFRVISPSYS